MAKEEMARREEDSFTVISDLDQRPMRSTGSPKRSSKVDHSGEDASLRPDRRLAGHRPHHRTTTSLSLWPPNESPPERRSEPRGGDLLPVPTLPGMPMRVQSMGTMPAIERWDQLEILPATGRQPQVLCGGSGNDHLSPRVNTPEKIECLPDQGDLPPLQRGDPPGQEVRRSSSPNRT